MNTKSKVLATELEAMVGHDYHRVLPDKGYAVTTLNAVNDAIIRETPTNENTMVKTIGMFFAAPFIALAYVMAFPFIGIYHFAKLALEAYAKRAPATNGKRTRTMVLVKNIGLFFAAPFVALGYVIALPMVGIYMILKLAKEAYGKRAFANS